jgi:hypothetical protein
MATGSHGKLQPVPKPPGNKHKTYPKWKPNLPKAPPVHKPPKPSMKDRLKEFRKRQLKRDLKYESGRREVAYQLPVRRTHSLVTNIIGVDVPKPMWEKGGGRRSYTSTYKSRRQARSSAHRAKLQRSGY